MMRHVVVCRKTNAPKTNTTEFVTLELSGGGEEGWSWGQVDVKGTRLEQHFGAVLERLNGALPTDLPSITITGRSRAEVEAEPPLTAQTYGPLCDFLPGAQIEILAPILRTEDRDKFELWSRAHRASDRRLWCNDTVKFRWLMLGNEMRRFFDAADERTTPWMPATFKDYASATMGKPELWIRPHWFLANPEFLPGLFQPPKPPVPINPDLLEAKAARADFVRRKEKVARQWRSRGYSFDAARKSWVPPPEKRR